MNNIIRKKNTRGTSISVNDLPSGIYYWRVNSIARAGGDSYTISSKIGRFTVEQRKNIEPPVLVYPRSNMKINRLVLKKKEIVFNWKKNPEVKISRFSLSKEKDFRDIIYSADTGSNYLSLKRELKPGVYYWRVGWIPDRGNKPVISTTRKFTVIKTGRIGLIKPVDNFTALPPPEGGPKPLRFSWNRTGIRGVYNLQISNDADFKSIFRRIKVRGLSKSVKNFDPGKYYWRVEFYDEEGMLLVKSNVRSFTVLDRLRIPVVIEPDNRAMVDMSGRDELALKWKRLKGADKYFVKLFRVDGGRAAPVAGTATGGTEFIINDLKKLEEGKFLWTIQAVDYGRGGGKILRKSPLLKSYFEIKLLNKRTEDVKKIKLPGVLIIE